MNKVVLIAGLALAMLLVSCGGDDGGGPATVATSPAPSPAESPTEAASPEETPTSGEEAADVDALIGELEQCLNDGGIETEVEESDLPVYGEAATIGLTFEYPQITVPDAVTLWIYESSDAAAKGKREIDKDLLQGDTETQLRGQVVVDDFGNTLETPEAAEQAAVLDSCTT